MLLELKSMKGLRPQTTITSRLQSNSRPCRRSELAMISSNALDFSVTVYEIVTVTVNIDPYQKCP